MSTGQIAFKDGHCYMEWSIESFFDKSPSVNAHWNSPAFHFLDAIWYLQLHPNSSQSWNDNAEIFLYLVMHESKTEIHNLSITLGIEGNDDRQYKSIRSTSSFNKFNNSYGAKLLKRSEIFHDRKEFSPDGVVTFFCTANVRGGESETMDADTQTSLQDGYAYLSQDLKELFLSEKGADVTIKVKDKEIRAHSQILSARSSVFAPMFDHDMKEKNTGVVEIPDFEPDAFREFLMFLYSGKTEKLSFDNGTDLYSAGDKYDLKEMKMVCSEFMKENITIDSFGDALYVAIKYGDKDLIEFLTDYFIKNVKKITVSLKWMSVVKAYPIETNELVIKLAHNLLPG